MTSTPFAEDDWGVELHLDVVRKLSELIDAADEDMYDPNHRDIETPSGAPFCGCLDCVVREVLTMGFERFEQEAQR
jgi:hypothetical protein